MCNDLALDSRVVAARVDAVLHELERSRSWLARRIGVSDMWVSRRLTGQTLLGLDDVPRLAKALDVEIGTLVRDLPDDPSTAKEAGDE